MSEWNRENHHDEHHDDIVRLREQLAEQDARGLRLAGENERLRGAFSRYGDHDRACDARENALYACTCGFVDRVNELFPLREVIAEDISPR
jgi:hypothetical protein